MAKTRVINLFGLKVYRVPVGKKQVIIIFDWSK